MNHKEHLTPAGLQEIVNLKASINRGLSDTLKSAFPNTKPVARPVVVNQVIKDPQWLAGFTSGEGSFLVRILKSSTHKIGAKAILRFQISQHSRDAELLKSLIKYLECGRCYSYGEESIFVVESFSEIREKIIPFFDKYPPPPLSFILT